MLGRWESGKVGKRQAMIGPDHFTQYSLRFIRNDSVALIRQCARRHQCLPIQAKWFGIVLRYAPN